MKVSSLSIEMLNRDGRSIGDLCFEARKRREDRTNARSALERVSRARFNQEDERHDSPANVSAIPCPFNVCWNSELMNPSPSPDESNTMK